MMRFALLFFGFRSASSAVVTDLRRIEQSRRMTTAGKTFLPADVLRVDRDPPSRRLTDGPAESVALPRPPLLTEQYLVPPAALLGQGGCGATFRATRKSDNAAMALKQLRNDEKTSWFTNNEVLWGQRAREQGFGQHDNICLVVDAFASDVAPSNVSEGGGALGEGGGASGALGEDGGAAPLRGEGPPPRGGATNTQVSGRCVPET